MTFPSTSHHPVSVAGANRAASGDPPSNAQRRVVIGVRPFVHPVGVVRRRVVAVAAATVLARDSVHARAPGSLAEAQRRPPGFQAAVAVVSPHRRAFVFTRRYPATALPATLAVAASYHRPLPGHVCHHRPSREGHHHDRWLRRQRPRVQPSETGTAGSYAGERQGTEPRRRQPHATTAEPGEPDASQPRRNASHLIRLVRDASREHPRDPLRSPRLAPRQRAIVASECIRPQPPAKGDACSSVGLGAR